MKARRCNSVNKFANLKQHLQVTPTYIYSQFRVHCIATISQCRVDKSDVQRKIKYQVLLPADLSM